ncbi:hypothetical protein HDU91_005409 [Kappamyces sp. JEL0680]|nr:hypothetical protein HDU91_005409 [Kappamyces sp. JEL0680]
MTPGLVEIPASAASPISSPKGKKKALERNDSALDAVDAEPIVKKVKTAVEKTKQKKKSVAEKQYEALVSTLVSQPLPSHEDTVQEDAVQEEAATAQSDTPKKSVSWGPKQVKPFKKNSLICTNEEAQKTPAVNSSAPKVLKKTDPAKIRDEKGKTFPLSFSSSRHASLLTALPSQSSSVKSWNSLLKLTGLLNSSLTLATTSTLLQAPEKPKHWIHISSSVPDMPDTIWIEIFSYLEPASLCKVQGVCRVWHPLALHQQLWQTLCVLEKIHCGPGIEQIWERCHGNKGRWWKEIYIEGVVGRENWIHGNHKKRLIALTDSKDAITCFKYDGDKLIVGTKLNRLMLFKPNQSAQWFEKPHQLPEIEFNGAHGSSVLCIDADSPAGFLLASGDSSGTLAVWNSFNGRLLAKQKRAHEKGISCILAVGSSHVISAGFDKMIRLFRLEKHNALGHSVQDSELSMFANPDKKPFWRSLFGKKEKTLPENRLTLIKEFKGHRGEIYCMNTICKKTMFATGSTDKLINLYDMKTGENRKTLKGHTDTISCLESRGDMLYSGSLDCVIRKWSISTGQCLSVFVGHSRWIKTIHLSGSLLLSGGWDETLILWNMEKGQLLKRVKLEMGPISNIQTSETKVFASCREEGFQHQLAILDYGRPTVGYEFPEALPAAKHNRTKTKKHHLLFPSSL